MDSINSPQETKYFLKKKVFLAITMLVVVFSLSANSVFAAKMKMSSQQVESIKTALDYARTVSNLGNILADGGNLTTVLNMTISGGEMATDATYGLLALTAINEVEFMDSVITQGCKIQAREYFDKILDEKTNLISHWKGVGFDIPRVAFGKIAGPPGALTLNTFSIIEKTVLIFTELENLKKEMQCDGLRWYFDLRKNGNESHEIAWDYAKWQIRGAGSPESEQQFAELYEKWEPYVTPFGISKEYKEQLAGELRNTLAAAAEENKKAFAEKQHKELSYSFIDKLSAKIENIKNVLMNLVSKVNPFPAGPIVKLPEVVPAEIPADVGSPQTEEPAPAPQGQSESEPESLEFEPQQPPELADASSDTQVPAEPAEPVESPATESTPELEPEPTPTVPASAENETVPDSVPSPEVQLCQRGTAGVPRQYRVLLNEVAWMGDKESPSNEWIELKNIWGMPIDLAGWQIQDKDQQIKIVFEGNYPLSAGGYYLLERTDDYRGALNNSNEALYLFDEQCNLEDEALANPDWPAGDNTEKKPMQRYDVFYWYTQEGTPGAENLLPLSPIYSSSPAPQLAPEPEPTPKIIISEVQITGQNGEKDDFVELYNPNEQDVNLTDWYLQRKTETGQNFSTYIPQNLFSGKSIQAKNYFLIANASSSLSAELIDIITANPLTENNTLVLKGPGGDIIDEVSTDTPLLGQSYGRIWSTTTENYGDFEIQTPTPKAQNAGLEEEGGGESRGGEGEFLSVVINEIAWAGTQASPADEWIELYNNTDSDIDITGWHLVSSGDGGSEINFFFSSIQARGYYLIERTNNDTVSDISADWTGSFGNGLSNLECEVLSLYDQNDNLIDETVCVDLENASWPAGQASPDYISMERIDPNLEGSDQSNWANNNLITRNGLDAQGNSINGTPKQENSVAKQFTEIPGSSLTFAHDFTLTRLGSPYIISGSVNVLPGAKLTIEPGVILKLAGSSLFINGDLIAQGEIDNPIVFTSLADDQYGGDTNGNGPSEGSAGMWKTIYFAPTSNSVLENAVIRHGGFAGQGIFGSGEPSKGAVIINGNSAFISDSLIENNIYAGIELFNSGASIQNTIFKDHKATYGLSLSSSRGLFLHNSMPDLAGSHFEGNGYAIHIDVGGDCPDLSAVTFNANTYNVFPSPCP